MQQVCLLFAGRRGLDDQKVRNSILRIPEVSRKLKQAQTILDQAVKEEVDCIDLFSYVLSSDSEYNNTQSLKSLVTSIVQIGLFERYIKFRDRPQFLVGRVNGTSALMVCAEKLSFSDFILESDYFRDLTKVAIVDPTGTRLAGVSLEEYGAYKRSGDNEYEHFKMEFKDAEKIIHELGCENMINQCIHIGPCCEAFNTASDEKNANSFSSISSIDLDPILSSFWKTA